MVLLVLVEWSGLELCFIYLYIYLFLIGGVHKSIRITGHHVNDKSQEGASQRL